MFNYFLKKLVFKSMHILPQINKTRPGEIKAIERIYTFQTSLKASMMTSLSNPAIRAKLMGKRMKKRRRSRKKRTLRKLK